MRARLCVVGWLSAGVHSINCPICSFRLFGQFRAKWPCFPQAKQLPLGPGVCTKFASSVSVTLARENPPRPLPLPPRCHCPLEFLGALERSISISTVWLLCVEGALEELYLCLFPRHP